MRFDDPPHLGVLNSGNEALLQDRVPEWLQFTPEPCAERQVEADLAMDDGLVWHAPPLREEPGKQLRDEGQGAMPARQPEYQLHDPVIQEGDPCLDRRTHRRAVRPDEKILGNTRPEIECAEIGES